MDESKNTRLFLFAIGVFVIVLIGGNMWLGRFLIPQQEVGSGAGSLEEGASSQSAEQDIVGFVREPLTPTADAARSHQNPDMNPEADTIEREAPLKDVILIQ